MPSGFVLVYIGLRRSWRTWANFHRKFFLPLVVLLNFWLLTISTSTGMALWFRISEMIIDKNIYIGTYRHTGLVTRRSTYLPGP